MPGGLIPPPSPPRLGWLICGLRWPAAALLKLKPEGAVGSFGSTSTMCGDRSKESSLVRIVVVSARRTVVVEGTPSIGTEFAGGRVEAGRRHRGRGRDGVRVDHRGQAFTSRRFDVRMSEAQKRRSGEQRVKRHRKREMGDPIRQLSSLSPQNRIKNSPPAPFAPNPCPGKI